MYKHGDHEVYLYETLDYGDGILSAVTGFSFQEDNPFPVHMITSDQEDHHDRLMRDWQTATKP